MPVECRANMIGHVEPEDLVEAIRTQGGSHVVVKRHVMPAERVFQEHFEILFRAPKERRQRTIRGFHALGSEDFGDDAYYTQLVMGEEGIGAKVMRAIAVERQGIFSDDDFQEDYRADAQSPRV